MEAFNIGIVGCGMIRKPYLTACGRSRWTELAACSDTIEERALTACKEAAENDWGRPVSCSYESMLADDNIDIVINITNPSSHYKLNKAALEAGKHVYSEKPLAVTREEGKELLDIARAQNRRICCAPDTFLGSAHQSARAAVDRGLIGKPTAASFFFAGGGPDGYHQDPEFFFQPGAGPMMDVGVYSLTQIVTILGPVKCVSGHSKITFPERTILSSSKYGQKMKVEVPTHVSASLEFENGVIGTFMTSFDIKGGHSLPHGEIYGTEGTLKLADPNSFTGSPDFSPAENDKNTGETMEECCGYQGGNRGIGAVDLAASLKNGRNARASGDLAYHVLDVAISIYESSETRRCVDVSSTVERPPAMPAGLCVDITD